MDKQEQLEKLEKKCEVLLNMVLTMEDPQLKIYAMWKNYMNRLEELKKQLEQ